MEYQDRLICFIDLLGFKSTIDQSEKEPEVAFRLFELFEEFKDGGLEKLLYGSIPYLGENGMTTAAQNFGEDILQWLDGDFDLVVTQFSDSFVISAPMNNSVSCEMLLRALCIIKMQFFFNLGMLMRGGMTVGRLVHKRGGALFGTAMNKAYELESKLASYPRIVISEEAYVFLKEILVGKNYEGIASRGFDGLPSFDLIRVFLKWKHYRERRSEVFNQLKLVEEDILHLSPVSHPKIAYLLHQWSLFEHHFTDEITA
jgi:hypothetical protein